MSWRASVPTFRNAEPPLPINIPFCDSLSQNITALNKEKTNNKNNNKKH